ncbi:hypothetical protein C4573_02855 [Candidatus Woesearchaeota archaeon]|nr:MAG: hypothetical protein C4573_02855 [Candidatus Woesearchaeota archaeon]
MAKEEDKNPNKLVDKHTKLRTDDIVAKFKEWYSDSDKALERLDRIQHEASANLDTFGDIEKTYFVEARGAHAKRKGVPKSFSLDKAKAKEEATELLYRVALEGIKQELGEDAVKVYKKNPHQLKQYISLKAAQTGEELDFYKLRNDLIQNRRNVRKSEAFQKFKEALAQSTIDDVIEEQHVTAELESDIGHHESFLKHVGGELEKAGYELSKATNVRAATSIYRQYASLGGKFTRDYLSKSQYVKEKKQKK